MKDIIRCEGDLRALWKCADCVCLDVDSTLCRGETIDDLADYVGKGDEVKKMTDRAMRGGVSFRDALTERLQAINPSNQDIVGFLDSHGAPKLTPGMDQLVTLLHLRGVHVYLVSGGFDVFIYPLADALGIPRDRVFANRINFHGDGRYAGFDASRPTSDAGGKGRVARTLKERRGYQRLVMVGDGATDMEAAPPADGFIGFGVNIVRATVEKNSVWFVHTVQELVDALN